MTTDQPLLTLASASEILARRWIELCANDEADTDSPDAAPRRLSEDAAADFLAALAGTLSGAADKLPDPRALAGAGRAFAWAAGSPSVAVEHLVALRAAIGELLSSTTPSSILTIISRLVDGAIVGIVRDSIVELERDALIDPLTGLLNRRALARNLELEIGRASRHGHRFTIIFIDIDGLKAVNDSQGHAAGDLLLGALATALLAVLRRGDSAYRIGGDEFVVLLPETEDDAAGPIMERISSEGAPPLTWGRATYPADGSTANEVVDAADRRLLERRRLRMGPGPLASAPDVGFLP